MLVHGVEGACCVRVLVAWVDPCYLSVWSKLLCVRRCRSAHDCFTTVTWGKAHRMNADSLRSALQRPRVHTGHSATARRTSDPRQCRSAGRVEGGNAAPHLARLPAIVRCWYPPAVMSFGIRLHNPESTSGCLALVYSSGQCRTCARQRPMPWWDLMRHQRQCPATSKLRIRKLAIATVEHASRVDRLIPNKHAAGSNRVNVTTRPRGGCSV